jgi:hypothetical protein
MSTTPVPCFCGQASCTGSAYHDDKVMKQLLVEWHNALKLARNGFDEADNNQRAAELAGRISAELAHCGGAVKAHCATLGIYVGEAVGVGGRDFS